jgi:hypothetical protein
MPAIYISSAGVLYQISVIEITNAFFEENSIVWLRQALTAC